MSWRDLEEQAGPRGGGGQREGSQREKEGMSNAEREPKEDRGEGGGGAALSASLQSQHCASLPTVTSIATNQHPKLQIYLEDYGKQKLQLLK